MNFVNITSLRLFRYGLPVAGVVLITLVFAPLHERTSSVTVALTFLLLVLFSATFFGRNPALLASFAAMVGFNFFFLPPVRTLTISDPQNLVAWAAFTITAIIAGELSAFARRRAEEAENQRGEIERLYRELQGAFEKAAEAEAIERSEKLKSSLLDAVTHDLRTPLTSIKAAATTLLEDKREKFLDGEGRKEFLDIINEETDRLNKFIEGIVGLAKVEANALQGRKTWGAADEIISNAVERARGQLSSRHILIEIERELPSVFVDASSISEVVYTLVDNAAKYSTADSRIRISARRADDEMIEIGVEDEGRGIALEMRERVFGKFFRSDDDIHNTAGGLGLGLAIARGIIESQGGRIWIGDGRDGYKTRAAFVVPVGDEEK